MKSRTWNGPSTMRYVDNATLGSCRRLKPLFVSKLSEVRVIYAVLAPRATVIIKDFLSIPSKLVNYQDISTNTAPDQWGEMAN